jgi:hypothetical protein
VDPDPAEQAALDRTYHRFLSALRARGWLSATPEGDQR